MGAGIWWLKSVPTPCSPSMRYWAGSGAWRGSPARKPACCYPRTSCDRPWDPHTGSWVGSAHPLLAFALFSIILCAMELTYTSGTRPLPEAHGEPAGQFYSVTQLALDLGVTARTIRFYEDKGLI